MHLLNLRPTARHGLKLLDLENTSTVCGSNVFSGSFTVLLELFVDVQKQLLDLVTREHVLLVKARTDAQMQGFF